MSWATPAELRAQVQRLWDRGDLLRAAISADADPPLRLRFRTPGAADLSEHFDAVRDWARSFIDLPNLRIEWRVRNHRVQGAQRLPTAAFVDTLHDALALVGMTRRAQRFVAVWRQTELAQPALLPWLSKFPLRALELADRWKSLLTVVAWLQAHPRPGIYLRQLDVPGLDSKFIESHRGVLTELLDLALPPTAVDREASGTTRFARRFGFLEKPLRIRFRLLDATTPFPPGREGVADVTLDAASFAELALPVDRVFITENEVNFLAFPPVDRAMVVFGAGYGWDALARADWLHRCALYYWGDIDSHGFAILDQLRGHFPDVESFLMDRETLLAHRAQWGEEQESTRRQLTRLTPAEAEVYDDLRFDRLRPGLRLEQERVAYRWLIEHLPDVS